jgi:hypothetical protein
VLFEAKLEEEIPFGATDVTPEQPELLGEKSRRQATRIAGQTNSGSHAAIRVRALVEDRDG